MTLIEVMVAMFIFALVSSGVIYTMLAVMTIGRDSRARQVASNLAAEAVDRAREEQDLFDLLDTSYSRELNGDTFVIERTSAWVSDPDDDFDCGGGGGQLRYKRVNIEVSWENMRQGSQPVRTDTIIDPKTKINDPLKGTLLVTVLNGEGEGTPGVSVTAQPTNSSGVAVGSPLAAVTTDAQGCAYVLRADPGSYRISISKADHRDVGNVASPQQLTSVDAGATASLSFSYDVMATFQMTYGEGFDPAPAVANAMPTTFVSTYGAVPAAASAGNPRSFTMFPFASGYSVLAGQYKPVVEGVDGTGCLSPDPGSWSGGARPDALAALPGQAVAGSVGVGSVQLDLGPAAAGAIIRAVSVAVPPVGSADPGCAEGYAFIASPSPLDASGRGVLALPYGTWELYRGNATNQTIRVTQAQMTPLTMGEATGGAAGFVTMDPRAS